MIHLHHPVLLGLARTLPLNKVSVDSMRAFMPAPSRGVGNLKSATACDLNLPFSK